MKQDIKYWLLKNFKQNHDNYIPYIELYSKYNLNLQKKLTKKAFSLLLKKTLKELNWPFEKIVKNGAVHYTNIEFSMIEKQHLIPTQISINNLIEMQQKLLNNLADSINKIENQQQTILIQAHLINDNLKNLKQIQLEIEQSINKY